MNSARWQLMERMHQWHAQVGPEVIDLRLRSARLVQLVKSSTMPEALISLFLAEPQAKCVTALGIPTPETKAASAQSSGTPGMERNKDKRHTLLVAVLGA